LKVLAVGKDRAVEDEVPGNAQQCLHSIAQPGRVSSSPDEAEGVVGIVLWIILFLVLSGLCAWVALGNGCESVAGLVAALFLGADVGRWSEAGIRLFVGLTWVLLAIWFVLGLVEPTLRL
jgi:hypothetical protein